MPLTSDAKGYLSRRSVLASLASLGVLARMRASAEPMAREGPAFELVDQAGRRVTARDLASKPSVIHFGYTKCPAICPTTLYEVATRMRELGTIAGEINFVFVTVDPGHDTPAVLADYVASFDARIIALSGAVDQITALASGLGATFRRHESGDGEYSFDHSVAAFLLERGWRRGPTLYMGVDSNEPQVLEALRHLVAPTENSATQRLPSGAAL